MTEASSQRMTTEAVVVVRRDRARLRLVLWTVIFLSGAIVGSGTTLLVVRNRVLTTIHHPEDMPARLAQQLRRMLDLDDQQVQQVEQIFRERQRALQNLRRGVQPKFEAELDQVDKQISAVLRPDQQVNWQARFQSLRTRWLPAMPAPE